MVFLEAVCALFSSQFFNVNVKNENSRQKWLIIISRKFNQISLEIDQTQFRPGFYVEDNKHFWSNSTDFTNFLLDEAKVAVVPGVEFGSDNNIRISYATSMVDIKEGIQRIQNIINHYWG